MHQTKTADSNSKRMVVFAGWLTHNTHAQMHGASAVGRPKPHIQYMTLYM